MFSESDKMNKFKLSVVIPTYNSGEGILDLFRSIEKQTMDFKDIEIIMVDDCSTDSRTLEILEEVSQFDNVKVIFLPENTGAAGTPRNKGLEIATGEYVIFADSDDTYNPDAFERMYEEIKSNDADMVITNFYKVSSEGIEKNERHFEDDFLIFNSFMDDLTLLEINPAIWAKMYRRSFILDNNITFVGRVLAQDLIFYIETAFAAEKIVVLDDFYSYNYVIGDEKGNESISFKRSKNTLTRLIEGYQSLYQLLVNHDKLEYFDIIFKMHLINGLEHLIRSDISFKDKKKLIGDFAPLINNYSKSFEFWGDNPFKKSLLKNIKNGNYSRAAMNLKLLKTYSELT